VASLVSSCSHCLQEQQEVEHMQMRWLKVVWPILILLMRLHLVFYYF
jgi:hypothetical protein